MRNLGSNKGFVQKWAAETDPNWVVNAASKDRHSGGYIRTARATPSGTSLNHAQSLFVIPTEFVRANPVLPSFKSVKKWQILSTWELPM